MRALHSFNLADVSREHRRNRPTSLATVDGTRRTTWPDFDDRANRLANALLSDGVSTGDVVLWLGQNGDGILECLAAAARIGAICCVANWRSSADELAFIVEDSAPSVVIWQEAEVGEAVRAARDATAAPGRWLQLDLPADADPSNSYESFLQSGDPEDPEADGSIDAAVLMLYTAAFTGRPNGALLSHQAVLTQSLMMAGLQQIDPSYVYLNCGPLFHVATFMTTLATYLMGGINVFTRRADAEEICRLIDSERCTGAFVMGPTIDAMLAVNAADDDGIRSWDLSSLRTFRGKPEWNEMITIDQSPWATKPAGFGQTELMGMLTFNALGGDCLGNSGRPSPMVAVRIVDPDGVEVPVGETGEIVARGPQIMVGYRNRPEETGRRQAGGWHHTGDLGRREVDGSLSFVGPKGRIIKSAAENIYPAEVEGALASHPSVREAAVIGRPDPTWWQVVVAIVVLHDDATASPDELIEHVRSKIASYKKPKEIILRTEPLPRHGWPIDYDTLDAEYGGGGYPGGG